jgi:hypothetical protein
MGSLENVTLAVMDVSDQLTGSARHVLTKVNPVRRQADVNVQAVKNGHHPQKQEVLNRMGNVHILHAPRKYSGDPIALIDVTSHVIIVKLQAPMRVQDVEKTLILMNPL